MEHLTTGWEPDLDAGDSLLRRFVLASAERNERLAAVAGGRSIRTDAFSAADPASPVMFDNAAVLLQPQVDLKSTIEAIVASYPPERHFVVLSAFPTGDLSAHGLELMGHPPLMYRPAGGAPPSVPTGLAIRRVVDDATLDVFVRTLVEAYPMPGAAGTAIGDAAVLDDAVHFYVGYVDDLPVATSGAWVGHGVNDVEWVSTRADHRGRGIGAALTWAATMSEPSLPAVLIASDDGQGVYAAMGYERLLRLTMWHRPPLR